MIGDRIKRLRKERKMSISQLAEKAGIAKSYLSSIERNLKVNPSVQIIERIAQALGVPGQTLIYHEKHGRLDEEWVSLVNQAIDSGITKEQFERYLHWERIRAGK
ncbi:helix-turn-helix domain-containing protein [Fictibacillus sp. KU28468]|nr:helix-turn-helix domain-containing protein [Fictibacillus sp. KU28468]